MAKRSKKKRLSKTKKAKKKSAKKAKKKSVRVKKKKAEVIEPPKLEVPQQISEAGNRIREAFEDARNRYPHGNVAIVHEYKFEVDGEWLVNGIRGEQTQEILRGMLEALLPDTVETGQRLVELGEGFWVTVGIRWHGKSEYDPNSGTWTMDESEDHYKKHEGMLEVSSNFRRANRSARVLSAFNAVIERSSKNTNTLIQNVEKKFKHKVAQVFVRINFNLENKQPKRHGVEGTLTRYQEPEDE